MRAILINPWTQTIEEVEVESGLQARYAILSGPTASLPTENPDIVPPAAAVRFVDRIELGKSPIGGEIVDIWIDDENLLSDRQAYFQLISGNHEPRSIGGRAVILGCDGQGVSIGTTLTVARVAEKVRFLPLGIRVGVPDPIVLGADSWDQLDFARRMAGI